MLRLQKEQSLRRLGLVFTVTALVIQAFAVFNPPEQAMASNSGDTIPGGVSSVSQILSTYESSNQDLKSLFNYIGITKNDLLGLDKTPSRLCINDRAVASFSRQHLFSSNEGELTHQVPTPTGISTFYSTPMALNDKAQQSNNCYRAFVGQSAKIGWFAIAANSGDVQVKQSTLKIPRGQFLNSTCRNIVGNAYDERQPNQQVKVYLFLGGPPGKGVPVGPITTNRQFTFAVPDNYTQTGDNLTVWGAMMPLGDWSEPMVQFDQPITIPSKCNLPQTPTATCESITTNLIERSGFKLTASAQAAQGASIRGYRYIITDSNNRVVFEKSYTSNALSNTSETINISNPGKYTAKVVINTTVGDRSSTTCTRLINISDTSRCMFDGQLSYTDKECRACPYNSGLWYKDKDCAQSIVTSKQVRNLTRNVTDANLTTVSPNDRLEYTLYTTNLGGLPYTTKIEENFTDVLTYSSLVDSDGGSLNVNTKILGWEAINLAPGQTDIRHVVVQINNNISSSPVGSNDPSAYNCSLTNAYGNTTRLKLACPLGKEVEHIIQKLPSLGVTENLFFGTILLFIVGYFYQRSRQLNKENYLAHHHSGKQQHLYAPDQVFSNLLHHKLIEPASRYLSITLARPHAIIAGSLAAFAVTLTLYIAAKYVGFALSGSEMILAFWGGWLLGNIYDIYLFTYRKRFRIF